MKKKAFIIQLEPLALDVCMDDKRSQSVDGEETWIG